MVHRRPPPPCRRETHEGVEEVRGGVVRLGERQPVLQSPGRVVARNLGTREIKVDERVPLALARAVVSNLAPRWGVHVTSTTRAINICARLG